MHPPTDGELSERARRLVARMAEVGRVVYAVPIAVARETFDAVVGAAGLSLRESDAETGVARHGDEGGDTTLATVERPDLGVRIFEVRGPRAVEIARAVIERTSFVPQTELLRAATDPRDPSASRALLLLAHMAVDWDDAWSDLFLLHLASPDPIARKGALSALFLAAMVSGARAPALELLREAHRRERFPKLRDDILDAIQRLEGRPGIPDGG